MSDTPNPPSAANPPPEVQEEFEAALDAYEQQLRAEIEKILKELREGLIIEHEQL